MGLGNERGQSVVITEIPTRSQLTCVCNAFSHCARTLRPFRIPKSAAFQMPIALLGELQWEEIRTLFLHIKISYPSIRAGTRRKP